MGWKENSMEISHWLPGDEIHNSLYFIAKLNNPHLWVFAVTRKLNNISSNFHLNTFMNYTFSRLITSLKSPSGVSIDRKKYFHPYLYQNHLCLRIIEANWTVFLKSFSCGPCVPTDNPINQPNNQSTERSKKRKGKFKHEGFTQSGKKIYKNYIFNHSFSDFKLKLYSKANNAGVAQGPGDAGVIGTPFSIRTRIQYFIVNFVYSSEIYLPCNKRKIE